MKVQKFIDYNLKDNFQIGEIVNGTVKNIKQYGVFIELDNGVVGLLHIEDISIARIKTPYERLELGQKVQVVVKNIDDKLNRIEFSYKELLGSWDDNIADLKEGMTIHGIIREKEKNKNGIFIELKPNLVGMAEYTDEFNYGQDVDVYIKKIIKDKKKIKLVIK